MWLSCCWNMAVMHPLGISMDILRSIGLHVEVKKFNQNNLTMKCNWNRFAFLGHENVIRLLIKHGSNVSTTARDGNTALHLAADWGDKIKYKTISQLGMELKSICILGHEKVVQLLIEHGSNVSATDAAGNTPLHRAAHLGKKSMSNSLSVNQYRTVFVQPLTPSVRASMHKKAMRLINSMDANIIFVLDWSLNALYSNCIKRYLRWRCEYLTTQKLDIEES